MNYAKLHGKYLKSMTIFGNLGLAAIRVRSNSAAIGYLRLTRNTLGYFRRNGVFRAKSDMPELLRLYSDVCSSVFVMNDRSEESGNRTF